MNNETNISTGIIPAYRVPILEEKIEGLNKRAEKLGVKPLKMEVVGDQEVQKTGPMGNRYTAVYKKVKVIGETPKLDGWHLVASVQRVEDERLLRAIPGQKVPKKYREGDFYCDHCNSNRRRKEVYILKKGTRKHVQVGSTCIQDFLGGKDPKALIARAEMEFSIDELLGNDDPDMWGTGNGTSTYISETENYLTAVSICIRRFGWTSRKEVTESSMLQVPKLSTADVAQNLCCPPRGEKKSHKQWIEENDLHAQKRDVETARKAMEWARNLGRNVNSDYLYNLGVACRADYVTYDTMGLVASVVIAYSKENEKKSKAGNKQSNHVGEVGVRQVFENLKVQKMNWFEAQYGTTTLVVFEDKNGNRIVWFSSKNLDEVKEGDKLSIKATVKKHDEYNGVSQTVVTRAKIQ